MQTARPPPTTINDFADFWRYDIGVNVIPADTKSKRPTVAWLEFQNNPIPEELHNQWKSQNKFSDGIAVILGKVWHNQEKSGLYLNGIDLDNSKAVEEICRYDGKAISIKELSRWTLVEQHPDDANRAHVYVYSYKPFTKLSSNVSLTGKIIENIAEILPAIEVKGSGEHGILFCSPSLHKNGQQYQIIGTDQPVIADDFEQHIDNVCKRYGISYLQNGKLSKNPNQNQIPIEDLFKPDFKVLEGRNRHEALLRTMESLIKRNKAILPLEKIKEGLARDWNNEHCIPPLDDKEFEKQWKCALEFIAEKNNDNTTTTNAAVVGTTSRTTIDDDDDAEELSVSQALRRKKGYVKVKGQVIGYSEVYNMISKVSVKCNNCGFGDIIDYSEKPVFRSPVKELSKCPANMCKQEGQTLRAEIQYTTAMHIELQDPEKFSEIERITVRLFEEDTKDVFAGKLITVTGNLYVVRENDNPNNKPITVLYAGAIEDARKQETELTQKDIEEILAWKKSTERRLQLEKEEGSVSSITSTLADQIASYFAPQIISYEYVKKGLLMAAANAGIHNDDKRIPKRMRINSLLIGDPSLAKSTFIRKIAEIVPNARYESCQSSTGLSLTAQVSREEGGIFTLRHGPISLANGSLCALNEIGQMHISEHKHFLDCMQEGQFTLNKYGFNAPISANTSIIASANPINNTWKDPENIEQNEFPTLTQIIHRFDFIFIFIENTDPGYLRDYVRRREANAKLSSQGAFDNYDNFLRKYLMYARTFNPTISDEAREMLDDYWINMGSAGVRGLPRKLESLESAAIALAKLKLKDVVEAEDVAEIMEFFNVILLHFRQTAAVSKNPRNIAYEECVDVLKSSKFAISYEEVVKSACQRNDKVGRYIGDKHTLAHNKKLRPILELLITHSHIIQTGQRPVALQWTDTERNTSSSNSLLSDLSDLSDLDVHDTDENNLQGSILNHDNKVLDKDENIKNGSDESRSDRSHRSDTKPKLPTVTITSISQQPIISVEEFFHDDPNTPWEMPPHDLDQSPCRHIIDKKGEFYSCKLHPKEANSIYLDAIEQHCKYKDPEVHKAEILRLLETGVSS